MELERLKKDVFEELKKLPASYFYHNTRHINEVMDNAKVLGKAAGLGDHDMTLLETAALLHDYGYLECYEDNEPVGAAAAEKFLPEYGYNPDDVAVISGMILATSFSRKPNNKLEGLLCDADVGYLGGDNFTERSDDLRKEFTKVGRPFSDHEWYAFELNFLVNFKFHTAEGQAIYGAGLAKNTNDVKKILESYK